MVRRTLFSTVVACCALALSACASSNLAFSLEPEEAVGAWTAGDGFDTVLELRADGSLTATDWPVPLACNGHAVDDVNELRDAETASFTGSWNPMDSQPYQLNLIFDDASCPRGGGFPNVWLNQDGSLDLCFIIPDDASADDLDLEQMFVLRKEPHDGIRNVACP